MAGYQTYATVDELIQALEGIEWFECFDALNRKRYEEELRKQFDPEDPWSRIVGTWFDAECVSEEGVHHGLIKEIASNSYGLFSPQGIRETWSETEEGAQITLSFRWAAQTFEGKWARLDDYIDYGFWGLLDKAVQETKPDLSWAMADGCGQDGTVFLNRREAIERAVKQGILPIYWESEDDFEEELAEADA
ncbi:MAG: hypothetical protein AAF517_05200 [Planctomycetota bacterium]